MSSSGTLCRCVRCQKTCSRLIEVSVQRSVQGTQVRKGEGPIKDPQRALAERCVVPTWDVFPRSEAFAVGAVLNIGGETCSFN